jgi:hypothetical protein
LYLTWNSPNIALSIIVFFFVRIDYTCPRNKSYGQGYVYKRNYLQWIE